MVGFLAFLLGAEPGVYQTPGGMHPGIRVGDLVLVLAGREALEGD